MGEAPVWRQTRRGNYQLKHAVGTGTAFRREDGLFGWFIYWSREYGGGRRFAPQGYRDIERAKDNCEFAMKHHYRAHREEVEARA